MFDRFTNRANKVMDLARKSAIRLRHEALDAAHVLLGLAEEGTSPGIKVLEEMGVTPAMLREQIEKHLPAGKRAVTDMELPFTPRSKLLLEGALEEARSLSHTYIGTEHLLLAALRLTARPIPEVLQALGIDPARVRNEVLSLLGPVE